MPRKKDITGQRFGRLVAVECLEERTKYGGCLWRCRCDCGGEKIVPLHYLRQGSTKSCGCLTHIKDISGQRFGRLVAVYVARLRKNKAVWRCRCDCGGECEVIQGDLISGRKKSCGCALSDNGRESLKLIDGTSITRLKSVKNPNKANKSGYTGVSFNRESGKWTARITFKRKIYHLGYFKDIQDAIKARQRAEEKLHDEFLKEQGEFDD